MTDLSSNPSTGRSIRIVGPGRAGQSFAHALTVAGVAVELLGRSDSLAGAAHGVDAVLLATQDRAIAEVAAAIEPGDAAVLHCSGATGLAPLAAHERRGSIHPLMALPDPETGAARLASGGWFAVSGDRAADDLVDVLGGQSFVVADANRALYHAAATVAANHLVALLGQVERLAEQAGVPKQAFFDLARGSLDDVAATSAAAALTGPAARDDQAVLDAHRAALAPEERALYNALAAAAADLARGPAS